MTLRLPSAEQHAIAGVLAEFLSAQFPLDRLRGLQTTDRAAWPALARMGAIGLSLPQANGGMDLSWVEEALACREAGRYLVSPSLVGSIIAAHVAARAELRNICDALLRGERRAGIGCVHFSSNVRAIDGDAGIFLLPEPGGVRLLECDPHAVRALACIDETVQLSEVTLPGTELARADSEELALAARLLVAALLCGLLEATRDMATAQALTRAQFGRPIGAFQAIKHRCADIALAAELCWSQTLHAADALAAGAPDAGFHVLAAGLLAGEEALKAARFNIQAHGAMGFTHEVDAHRLLKRAHVLHQLFGDARAIPARLLDMRLDI